MKEDHWHQNLVDVASAIDISPDDDESGLCEAGNPSPDHNPTTVEGLVPLNATGSKPLPASSPHTTTTISLVETEERLVCK